MTEIVAPTGDPVAPEIPRSDAEQQQTNLLMWLGAERDHWFTRAAALEAQLNRVREVHQPIEALNIRHRPNGRLTQVCSGCGTDDGNWQIYPCPTIRALKDVR